MLQETRRHVPVPPFKKVATDKYRNVVLYMTPAWNMYSITMFPWNYFRFVFTTTKINISYKCCNFFLNSLLLYKYVYINILSYFTDGIISYLMANKDYLKDQ